LKYLILIFVKIY